jgi:hypothetical protein
MVDWRSHEQRAGDLVTELRSLDPRVSVPGDSVARRAWVQRARQLSPEVLASLLLLLVRRAAADGGSSWDTGWPLTELNAREYTVTDEEAAYALRASAALPGYFFGEEVLSTALAMAARARPGTSEDLRSALEALSRSVDEWSLAAQDRSKLKRWLARLLPQEPARGTIDTSVIVQADGWAGAVLPELSAWQGGTASVNGLLRHLAMAAGSKPSKGWLAKTEQLVRDACSTGPATVLASRCPSKTSLTSFSARPCATSTSSSA